MPKDDRETFIKDIEAVLVRRTECCRRLVKALAHLPVEQQYFILTSNISIDELEDMVRLQEGTN